MRAERELTEPPGHQGETREAAGPGQDPSPALAIEGTWRAGWKMCLKERGETQAGPCHGGGADFGPYPENEGSYMGWNLVSLISRVFCLFVFLAEQGTWDLIPNQGVNLCLLPWKQSPNHWTAREVPDFQF